MTYITPEGYNLLKTKLKELWKKERPYVTQKVKEAAALGDRSENAEYIYGKRQLREIDRKIRLLSGKLDSAKVIDRLPKDRNKVYFGAWVTVASDKNKKQKYFSNLEMLRGKKLKRPPYWGGFYFIPFHFEFWEGHEYRLNKRTEFKLNKSEWEFSILEP